MDAPFLSYLDLLRDLGASLDQLSQLAQEKMASVRQDDLIALDEVIKQEQAMSLNLRGLEQRRLKLMDQLELSGVPLDNLSGHYPKDLQLQAKHTTQALRRSYELYRSYADAARSTLELNLHELDKAIAASGGAPEGSGMPSGMEPPKNMKSDFRA